MVVAPSSIAIWHDLGGELPVGSGGVHRGELDVLARAPCAWATDGAREPLHVLARGLQLVLDVDVGRRDERVDPRSFARP